MHLDFQTRFGRWLWAGIAQQEYSGRCFGGKGCCLLDSYISEISKRAVKKNYFKFAIYNWYPFVMQYIRIQFFRWLVTCCFKIKSSIYVKWLTILKQRYETFCGVSNPNRCSFNPTPFMYKRFWHFFCQRTASLISLCKRRETDRRRLYRM